jgi:hypothetical protein
MTGRYAAKMLVKQAAKILVKQAAKMLVKHLPSSPCDEKGEGEEKKYRK